MTNEADLAVSRSLPIASWPRLDADAWAQALVPKSVLDDAGVASTWRPITRKAVTKSYGQWLAFPAQRDVLDHDLAPAQRVTREHVQAYVDEMRERDLASATIHMRVLHLQRFLEAVAGAGAPTWLTVFIRRLKAAVVPTRDDRAKLIPVGELLALGLRLVDRAENNDASDKLDRAIDYRDGLMILVLCACSVRLRNLADLELGRSLVREGLIWWVRFNKTETKRKTGSPIDLPLPAELTPTIERYLDLWRPILREPSGGAATAGDKRPDHNFLWINSHTGAPLKKLADRIVEVMRRELGRHFNVHLFRKLAPTELAIRDPEHVGIAQVLLGHARYDTTETFYNLGQSLDAARTVHATLAALRPPSSAPRARQPYINSKKIGDKP